MPTSFFAYFGSLFLFEQIPDGFHSFSLAFVLFSNEHISKK